MPDDAAKIDLKQVAQRAPIDEVHWLDTVDSTNNAALGRAAAGRAVKLFLSDNQRAGRGRSGAAWWSGPGALTFSLLVDKPALPPRDTPRVSLAVGLAVCRAVERFVPAELVRLKWPNDVFVAGRKACGVLIEGPSDAPERLVVGIGLNVNNRVSQAPDELQPTAISLRDALDGPLPGTEAPPLDRTEVLIACLEEVLAALRELVDHPAELFAAVEQRSLLTGRRVTLETPGRRIEGLCLGIAADGALRIDTPAGEEACYGGAVARID